MQTVTSPKQASVPTAGILAAVMGAGSVFAFAAAALSPFLVESGDLSPASLGKLVATSFIAAAISSLFSGASVRIFGPVPTILATLIVALAGTVATNIGWSASWWMVAAVLYGPIQAVSNPATNLIVRQYPTVELRVTGVGIKQSGVPVVQLLLGILLPLIAHAVGARISFTIASGLILAVIVLLWPYRHNIPSQSPAISETRNDPSTLVDSDSSTITQTTLSNHQCSTDISQQIRLLFAVFLGGVVLQAVSSFMPVFAHSEHNTNAVVAGSIVGAVGLIGIMGRQLWSNAFTRWQHPGRLLAVLMLISGSSIVLLTVSPMIGQLGMWIGIVGYSLTTPAYLALVMIGMIETLPEDKLAVMSGWVGAAQFVGFAVGPLLTATLKTLSGSYDLPWSIAAGLCVLGAWLAVGAFPRVQDVS